jgi:hypothetical protein
MLKTTSMKKIFYLLSIVTLLYGCENKDVDFPDFAFQAVFFPYQTPVRTLSLGDEEIGDNSIDLEHAFSIGAAIGGMYENTKDREITIEYAPDLAIKIKNGSDTIKLLPTQYYNATFDKITIPAGSFFGKLRVNLTDAFFTDSLTTGMRYVIPLRITGAQGDSILTGVPLSSVTSPDPRIAAHWAVQPKNYVLFGVKYINPTHGVYLLRGKRKNINIPTDSLVYSKSFIDDNDITKLSTRSMTENYMSTVGGGSNKEATLAKWSMKLLFDNANKSVTVSRRNAATVSATGTGKFYSKADAQAESYNGKKHRTIYLDYTYIDGPNTYHVNDSLVFVDTDLKFETFAVTVFNP